MSLQQLEELFLWMTVLNAGIFILTAVLAMTLRGFVGRLHGRLFGIDEEQVAVVTYGYLGTYRLLILVFNLVPWFALLLMRVS